MSDNVTTELCEVHVDKVYKRGKDDEVNLTTPDDREVVQIVAYPEGTPVGSITCSLAYTKNLGNYESAKVMASFTVPCVPQEADDAWDFAARVVTNKMNECMEEFEALASGN